jgi:hypothetical protein
MTALFAVGPLNTASAGRSLLLNAFVASFICFFVYYATSFSAVDVTKGALKLRGNELEGKNYPGELESDRDPQVVWIMSFGGSVRDDVVEPFHRPRCVILLTMRMLLKPGNIVHNHEH